MLNLTELNKHFDVRPFLTEGQYEMLVAANRVFITHAQFTTAQALKFINPPSEEEKSVERENLKRLCGYSDADIDDIQEICGGKYGGHLITAKGGDFGEAQRWIISRGFGEVLKGCLGGSIPLDEVMSQQQAQRN
jgi:hypothetical protein